MWLRRAWEWATSFKCFGWLPKLPVASPVLAQPRRITVDEMTRRTELLAEPRALVRALPAVAESSLQSIKSLVGVPEDDGLVVEAAVSPLEFCVVPSADDVRPCNKAMNKLCGHDSVFVLAEVRMHSSMITRHVIYHEELLHVLVADNRHRTEAERDLS